jgi:hypothetical protein
MDRLEHRQLVRVTPVGWLSTYNAIESEGRTEPRPKCALAVMFLVFLSPVEGGSQKDQESRNIGSTRVEQPK